MSTTPASIDTVYTHSARFNDDSADFVLVSSDDVKFSVHQANLAVGSPVFRDMLEIGQSSNKGEKEESRLEEDSATLEAVLPYLYAKSVPVVEITDFSFILKMIKCCDKYQIERCHNAVREGFWVATTKSQLLDDTHVVKQLLYGFDFASRFDEVKLRDHLLCQLKTKPIALVADSYDTVLCGSLATAELLQSLTSRHARGLKSRNEETARLISTMYSHSDCSRGNLWKVFDIWNQSTSDLWVLKVRGAPPFDFDCGRCNTAVSNAFHSLLRSL